MKSEVVAIEKPKMMSMSLLHIQYIPVVTCREIWTNQYGLLDMTLLNSPHVELMQIFMNDGYDIGKIGKSRYYAERVYRKNIGMKRWNNDYIWYHIRKRYHLFKSIRNNGYDKKYPIEILEKPFWSTRFKCSYECLLGPEIWTGAGRASAWCALGNKTILAQWYEDTMPGSGEKGKFDEKLGGVKGVWGDGKNS